MNRALTLESLRTLVSQRSAPCVSLYMPTVRHHNGAAENRIRYRNLVARAEKLLGPNLRAAQVRERIGRLEALSNEVFWGQQLDGLAVFADGNGAPSVKSFRLPGSVPELAVVADSFHIRPLLRCLQASGRYFLLRLSQNEVALFAGDQHGLAPVSVPGLPASLDEALGEPSAAMHTVRSIPGDHGAIHYHVAGTGKAPQSAELLRYFRAIDNALWSELREQKEPLMLAAPVSYHTPFRSAQRYPHLLEEGLQGNYERSGLDELHTLAWPLVSHHIERRLATVLQTYQRWISARRAIDELSEIARAALQGRVLDLMVAEGSHLWGRVDPTTADVQLHAAQEGQRDDDVLDDLSEAVLLRGGDVFAVARERMPSSSPVAALLRW
jgi:Bacterial archaeo-eukaryotic release factor family 3